MKYNYLASLRDGIPYRKDIRKAVGSVTATILMQQLDFHFAGYPDGFYKFLSPVEGHPDYREGDSWTEELAFSEKEFRCAFDRIGVRHLSKSSYTQYENPFIDEDGNEKYYCSYHDKQKSLTWYFRNHKLVDELVEKLIKINPPKERKRPSKVDSTVAYQKSVTVDDQREDCSLPKVSYVTDQREATFIYKENTENTTKNSFPPTPQGEEKEKSFGFEIPKEGNPNPLASLESKSGTLHQTATILVRADVPPPAKTDKFFTGKTLNQQKYDRWASAAHPALVYAGEETPWLEPPCGMQFIVFNKNFVDWHSSREMEQYGKDKERASADFQGSLRNDPERCATRWQEYQNHMVRHAASAAARVNNGIEITEVEKQKFTKHQRAFVGVTADSSENIDPQILNAAKSVKPTPQIESVATVNDDMWDAIAQQNNEWEEQQTQEARISNFSPAESKSVLAPEDADNPLAYQEVVKPEDRDYFAKLHQSNLNSQPSLAPVTSADVREQVRQATERMSMASKNIKAAKLEQRRVAFWNNQLRSGDANAIALATQQAIEAGYPIVNGQVEDVEF